MATGYDYRCDPCDTEWLLFSKRLYLGPTQWSHARYTCFTCQTLLTMSDCVDRNSWNVWLSNNRDSVYANGFLLTLANAIDLRLASVRGLATIKLTFSDFECPTCHDDRMINVPFGQHLMRCPKCRQYTGHAVDTGAITNYLLDEGFDDSKPIIRSKDAYGFEDNSK